MSSLNIESEDISSEGNYVLMIQNTLYHQVDHLVVFIKYTILDFLERFPRVIAASNSLLRNCAQKWVPSCLKRLKNRSRICSCCSWFASLIWNKKLRGQTLAILFYLINLLIRCETFSHAAPFFPRDSQLQSVCLRCCLNARTICCSLLIVLLCKAAPLSLDAHGRRWCRCRSVKSWTIHYRRKKRTSF